MNSRNRAIMMVVAIAAILALATTALVGGNPETVMASSVEQTAMTIPIDQDVQASGHTDRPGLSIPYCESNGIFMYWHTKDGGSAAAPDGWRVERRNYLNGEYVTRAWEFTGSDADDLQVYSDRYWDWKDRTRSKNVSYTHRVSAINTNGSYTTGRE